jgi:hypothetical protein
VGIEPVGLDFIFFIMSSILFCISGEPAEGLDCCWLSQPAVRNTATIPRALKVRTMLFTFPPNPFLDWNRQTTPKLGGVSSPHSDQIKKRAPLFLLRPCNTFWISRSHTSISRRSASGSELRR